jgi:hypothetical protein
MSKRVMSGISVGVLAAATMLGTSHATLAADDCLTGPTRAPAPGGHWYYHLDRASDRKCWYLVEPPSPAPLAQAPQLQFAPEPAAQPAQPGLGSFFSALGFPTTPQPNTTGDARIAQPAPADDLKNGEAPPARQSRVTLASKPRRLVHLRPPAEHIEDRPAAPLNQAERDALFEEFLKWRERQ